MPTSLDLRDKRGQLVGRMREILDLAESEDREMTAEERSNYNKIDEDDRSLIARIADAEKLERTPAAPDNRGMRAMETATVASNVPTRARPEYQQAFMNWMRRGSAVQEELALLREGFAVLHEKDEWRALSVGSSTAGGFLVPDDLVRRIEKAEAWFGGMREVATIIKTSDGSDLQFPTSNDTGNVGAILAENTQISEQDTTFGLRVLKAFMYTSLLIRVSYQLLQDSAFDLEGYLADILAERIGRITNTHFTVGIGPNQPSGIVPDAAAGITAAATGAVTADEVIDLEHAVNKSYRGRARYMFHDLTLREVKQLKDGIGNYLWKPGLRGADPDLLNNYPYTINNDMAQMATGVRSILFGDLKKYIIRDVLGMRLVRLDERYADFLQVGFFAYSRHDGMLLDAGGSPVVALTMA